MIGAWSDSRWRLQLFNCTRPLVTIVLIVVAKVAILRRAILSMIESNGHANKKSLVAELQ